MSFWGRAFDQPRTQAMRNFLKKEVGERERVVGLSIEDDGVFIYTNSWEWCDDAGAGTFREDSETAAIRKFYERVQKARDSDAALYTCTAKGCSNFSESRFCEGCGNLLDEKKALLIEVEEDIRITKHLADHPMYPGNDSLAALEGTAEDLRCEISDTE